MRQNGTTSAPFFYCVSYEILCETRIKPGFFWQLSHFPIFGPGGPVPGLSIRANGHLPSQSRLPPCQLPQGGSQVGSSPDACRKPSLASPLGGRWCPVGTVQRLVSAAASVGAGRLPLADITRAGRREWTRVSEDGEGEALPAGKNASLFP